jgi:hypothetical protein
MTAKNLKAGQSEKKSSDMNCSDCGSAIFPEEIYYTLCVHMETRNASTDKINILEIRPIAFRCRLCEEKWISVC